ncbi:MAG: hypothetical protein U5K79_13135 [Cyclobacteriaceae bacterium]|nr:hypothetical protein [Cyclobacteriaceae bacterium]
MNVHVPDIIDIENTVVLQEGYLLYSVMGEFLASEAVRFLLSSSFAVQARSST